MFISILTTSPNKKMAKINYRMPVILQKKEFGNWFIKNDKDYLDYLMSPANNDWIKVNNLSKN